jgi:hypothetical protein
MKVVTLFQRKFLKLRVEKFYLFFDPYFSLLKKKIGDTEYGIGWLTTRRLRKNLGNGG